MSIIQPSPPPAFITIGGHILNTSQIKWAGKKDGQVYVEFVTGGWITLEESVMLSDLRSALYSH